MLNIITSRASYEYLRVGIKIKRIKRVFWEGLRKYHDKILAVHGGAIYGWKILYIETLSLMLENKTGLPIHDKA